MKSNAPPNPTSILRILSLVFFMSGSAGLMYQVVWQRAMTLYYGVGAISMTLIVSVYMLGLGVGSLVGGFLAAKVRRRLRLYCIIELLIGCFGFISLHLLDLIGRSTVSGSYLAMFAAMFLFLCLPTGLMGTTLPLLTVIFNRMAKDFLHTVSWLYFVNTIGAACGALVSSYVFISLWGLDTTVYLAAAINLGLAALLYEAGRIERTQIAIAAEKESEIGPVNNERFEPPSAAATNNFEPRSIKAAADRSGPHATASSYAYVLVVITGFLAIGYEIIWLRLIGALVKVSPYAFSSVLFIYLLAIGSGSYVMDRCLRRLSFDRRQLFYSLQVCIAAVVLVGVLLFYYGSNHTAFGRLTEASFLTGLHPSYPSFPGFEGSLRSLFCIFDIVWWPAYFIFTPALLMGASFPLATALAGCAHTHEGQTVGRVYCASVVGNVAGGILTGFLLLPSIGTERTLVLFIAIGLSFALLIRREGAKRLSPVTRVAMLAGAITAVVAVFPRPSKLYETIHPKMGSEFISYFEEGIDGICMTFMHNERMFHYINGVHNGGRIVYLYYFITAAAINYAPPVEHALVIGYGNGTITELVQKLNTLKRVTVVELSHVSLANLNKISLFRKLLADPRLRLIVDDGRRFLLQNQERYDLILMDTIRSTYAYSNNLYSQEFLRLLSQHLTPNGVLMMWLDEHRVMPKTIASVLPHVRLYSNLCLASNAPLHLNESNRDLLDAQLTEKERAGIARYSNSYLGDERFIRAQTKDYPINRDWQPVCEYFLGLQVRFGHDYSSEPSLHPLLWTP